MSDNSDSRQHATVADLMQRLAESAARQDARPQGRFYVMAAGRRGHHGSRITLLCARTARQAHEMAVEDYRKAEQLPTSTHVDTERLHEAATEAEARDFIDRLEEAMAARVGETDGKDPVG